MNKIHRLFSEIKVGLKATRFFGFIKWCFLRKRKYNTPYERDKIKTKCLSKYNFDFDNPRSFNEHLIWLKYNYSNDLWKMCADKLKVKEFLKENGYEKYVPKTLNVYKSIENIKLDELPEKFVLKTNHDCGSVFVCEKGKTNFTKIFKKLSESINKKYSSNTGEWMYSDIEPLIFAEELLIPVKGNDLSDYKFVCSEGKFVFGFSVAQRSKDIRFNLFDENYKFYDSFFIHPKSKSGEEPLKPVKFDEMLSIAKSISKILKFCRVDMFDTKDGIRIGEITFITMSGFGVFEDQTLDFKFGEMIKNNEVFKR